MSSGLDAYVLNTPVVVQPTLKVMRLYKPRLYTSSMASKGGDPLQVALSDQAVLQKEFIMSNMLCLPDSFGQIFLGNTFSSYISVINPYNCPLEEVGLTANIQCGNDRVELQDNREARTGNNPPKNPIPSLAPNSCLDMVVDHALTQVGSHVLRVGVTYLDPMTKEPKSLRKFYRFAVQNPLILNFRQYGGRNQGILVQAQVRNISTLPIFIDGIQFAPTPNFSVLMVPESADKEKGEQTMEKVAESEATVNFAAVWKTLQGRLKCGLPTLLQPQEELQRIFRIQDQTQKLNSEPALVDQRSQALGRLHVNWKTSMGEAGSVQSQPVVRKIGSMRDVIVRIHSLPDHIKVEGVFSAKCTIENNSARTLHLQLQFRKSVMDGIVCYHLSDQNLGVLTPCSQKTITVTLLPLMCGLQQIRDFVCVDLRTGQEFYQQEAVYAIVHAHQQSQHEDSCLDEVPAEFE